jgi:hypothetical protein
MDNYKQLYEEIAAMLGEDAIKLNHLILLERAANQRHWAGKIEKVMKFMTDEANKYEELTEEEK